MSGVTAGALSACNAASGSTASSAASSEAASTAAALTYTPGTYEATAKGIESDVKVSVTFSKGQDRGHRHRRVRRDQGIGADIGDKMKENILSAQTCSVDGVSGAPSPPMPSRPLWPTACPRLPAPP